MKTTLLLLAAIAILSFKTQAQITDYDGNVYDTIAIGNQIWFKQNLKVTHYNNGTDIPNVSDSATWASLTTGARCYFNNDSAAYDSIYGALYNWRVVSSTNSICPNGWHVGTDAEWTTLENFLGGYMVAGGKMKEAGTLHWLSPNASATNSSRFSGLPGGMRDPTNTFSTINENGLWWTSTAQNGTYVWSRYLWYQNGAVDANPTPKKLGLCIRCMMTIPNATGTIESNEKINLYPNPANNSLYVDCGNRQNSDLSIYNIVGEQLLQLKLKSGSNQIDIRSLPAGIYLVKITGTHWVAQQKFIKE